MVGSVNSVVAGNVYHNTSENVDVSQTDSRRNIKDTQAYQTLVKLVGYSYKGVDETKEDKAAVRKESQQLLNQLHSGLGSSDTSTGNVITVSMPKSSALLTLLVAMIESENESSIAGYKMSGELGVISQDFTNAAADELREQGKLALSSGITSGATQMIGSGVGIGTGFLKGEAQASAASQGFMGLGRGLSEAEQGSFGMVTKNSEAEQTSLQASSKMIDQTMEMSRETAQKAAQVMSSLLSLMADVRHSTADLVSTVSSNLKA